MISRFFALSCLELYISKQTSRILSEHHFDKGQVCACDITDERTGYEWSGEATGSILSKAPARTFKATETWQKQAHPAEIQMPVHSALPWWCIFTSLPTLLSFYSWPVFFQWWSPYAYVYLISLGPGFNITIRSEMLHINNQPEWMLAEVLKWGSEAQASLFPGFGNREERIPEEQLHSWNVRVSSQTERTLAQSGWIALNN